MRLDLIDFNHLNIKYHIGNSYTLFNMPKVKGKSPFDDTVRNFLDAVSKALLVNAEAKKHPDIVTFAFWIRKASTEQLKKRFYLQDNKNIKLGRGIVFHIAPSNVPVNYAYSLVTGLLCGNKNIVKIPSKDFEQVNIINDTIKLKLADYEELNNYICLVQYGHDKEINDIISAFTDVRIIWGGDNTISEIRQSPLQPRASEITFADRYSIAVIDSDYYMNIDDKADIAKKFYNDTYLSDQNACTSPRIVVWRGDSIKKAKEEFWKELHTIVADKYELHGVQAVNKLTASLLLAAVSDDSIKKISLEDNLIVRVQVNKISAELMEFKNDSGYFFEYDCLGDAMELWDLCDNIKCQTVAYIGNTDWFVPLIISGINGVDRVVPVGKTMDFDFYWDGYNLFERMTRNIVITSL